MLYPRGHENFPDIPNLEPTNLSLFLGWQQARGNYFETLTDYARWPNGNRCVATQNPAEAYLQSGIASFNRTTRFHEPREAANVFAQGMVIDALSREKFRLLLNLNASPRIPGEPEIDPESRAMHYENDIWQIMSGRDDPKDVERAFTVYYGKELGEFHRSIQGLADQTFRGMLARTTEVFGGLGRQPIHTAAGGLAVRAFYNPFER
jgi:hypothetical protein